MSNSEVKYIRTALAPETHGELKKQCAINGISMQDFVSDLIASNLEETEPLARALASKEKQEIQEILKAAKKIRGNNAGN